MANMVEEREGWVDGSYAIFENFASDVIHFLK